jgi:hypothetical protein
MCSLHVMTSWVKIRNSLIFQQQQHDSSDALCDALLCLLDDVKSFVRRSCQWTCDSSHFHSDKGMIGTINSWILSAPSPSPSQLSSSTRGVLAQVCTRVNQLNLSPHPVVSDCSDNHAGWL